MANISIPLNVCLQLQKELAALAPNNQSPGLLFLQHQINSILPASPASSVKRPIDTPSDNKKKKVPRVTEKGNNSKGLSRNDGRKRRKKQKDKESSEEEDDEETGDSEETGVDPEETGGDPEGEGVVVKGGGGSKVGKEKRVRIPKPKPWETVADLRKLTDFGGSILQSLAAISEQEHLHSLLLLKDRLSLSSNDIPQIPSIDSILQRCLSLDINVVEESFHQMVGLMQLSLWINQ